MKKEDKNAIISDIKEHISQYQHFYITDIEGLNAEKTSALRAECFKNDVRLMVTKNTLLHKALEQIGVDASLFDVLKGNTALMLSNTGNAPAKIIKKFKDADKGKEGVKPELKAAYVEESVYIGAQNLLMLVAIKSKNELIGELISLLQSPTKNVVSALQSGANTLHGVLKTLGERAE